MKPLDSLRCLVLNAGYEPLLIVTWQRAVILAWEDKVDVVETYETVVRSPSVAMGVPAVVRLRQWLRFRAHGVRFSRRNLFLRDEHRCQYCLVQLPASALTLDHVVPRWRGGPTSWDNIVTCCVRCNRRKGGLTPDEAGMALVRPPRSPRGLSAGREGVSPREAPMQWRAWLKAA